MSVLDANVVIEVATSIDDIDAVEIPIAEPGISFTEDEKALFDHILQKDYTKVDRIPWQQFRLKWLIEAKKAKHKNITCEYYVRREEQLFGRLKTIAKAEKRKIKRQSVAL